MLVCGVAGIVPSRGGVQIVITSALFDRGRWRALFQRAAPLSPRGTRLPSVLGVVIECDKAKKQEVFFAQKPCKSAGMGVTWGVRYPNARFPLMLC